MNLRILRLDGMKIFIGPNGNIKIPTKVLYPLKYNEAMSIYYKYKGERLLCSLIRRKLKAKVGVVK